MATEPTRGSEALLAFARELRRAISVRRETMQKGLDVYDHATGDRLDQAAKFLRSVQLADSAYESSVQDALECFREEIEESPGL
jgi:hypothetical protein